MWNYREKEIYSFSEISPKEAEKIDPENFRHFVVGPGSVGFPEGLTFYRFRLRRFSVRSGVSTFSETGVAALSRPDLLLFRLDTGEVLREGLFISDPSGIIVYGPTFCEARKEAGLDEGLTPLF